MASTTLEEPVASSVNSPKWREAVLEVFQEWKEHSPVASQGTVRKKLNKFLSKKFRKHEDEKSKKEQKYQLQLQALWAFEDILRKFVGIKAVGSPGSLPCL